MDTQRLRRQKRKNIVVELIKMSELIEVADYTQQWLDSKQQKDVLTKYISEDENITETIRQIEQNPKLSFAECVALAIQKAYNLNAKAERFSREWNSRSGVEERLKLNVEVAKLESSRISLRDALNSAIVKNNLHDLEELKKRLLNNWQKRQAEISAITQKKKREEEQQKLDNAIKITTANLKEENFISGLKFPNSERPKLDMSLFE